jgi:hypothetical protein
MRWFGRALTTGWLLLALISTADAQAPQPPEPTVRPAIDGILAAFEKYPLVGLGDMHGPWRNKKISSLP